MCFGHCWSHLDICRKRMKWDCSFTWYLIKLLFFIFLNIDKYKHCFFKAIISNSKYDIVIVWIIFTKCTNPVSDYNVNYNHLSSSWPGEVGAVLFWFDPRHIPLALSSASLGGNGGSVPYRRLCTMAQVPLNLWKFLPEANIARNSNLGLSLSLTDGSNNSRCNNGNGLIWSLIRCS